jgi:magnesium and cobalt exporter, CNNM family
MTGDDAVALVVAICLVPLGGLLACVDSALGRVSVARVEEFLRQDRPGARALSVVVADRARYTNLLLMLRMSCELTATVLVFIVARSEFGTWWGVPLGTVTLMVVICYAVIGVGPRTLGRQHPNRVALAGAGAVRLLGTVFGPLASLLTLLGNAITPGRGFRDGPFSSEVELRELVDMAEQRGVVEHGEREMIQSVFELGDTIAREVMVPRTDVVYIERNKTLRQAMSLFLRSGYSRLPVIEDDLDDIVGFAYLKDISQRVFERHDAESSEKVGSVMRPVHYVPDTKPVDDLLREMQADQRHVAVVVDEYGGTAGLVTIEDILEEIVGEIADEHDQAAVEVETLDDGSTRVSSRYPVDDLDEIFGIRIHDDEVDSVGGLMAKHLGKVPIPGSVVEAHGLLFEAESAAGRRNRIGTVLIRPVLTVTDTPAAAEPSRRGSRATGPADARTPQR